MDAAAPTGGSRPGRRRWPWIALLVLVALPLALFALSNLWLASPWGRGWIGSKVTAATTLEASVGGASWSPWNGATLHDLRLEQPEPLRRLVDEPLVTIGRLRLDPVWREWLRGRASVRGIDLEKPRVVLPVQILSHLSAGQSPPGAVVVAPDEPAAAVAVVPGVPGASEDPAAPAEPPPTEVAPAPAPAPAAEPGPQAWVRIREGSLKLVFAGWHDPLLEVPDISGDLPLAGAAAKSKLTLGPISLLGERLTDSIAVPLDWSPPVLSLGLLETQAGGLKVQAAAKLARTRGMPLQIEISAPPQAPPPAEMPGGRAQAGSFAGDLRLAGLLLAPGTWQGQLVTRATDIFAETAGHATRFSLGGCVILLRGGAISCADARLIGDDYSLLGNATILADGRTAAVLRLVAEPDVARSIVRRVFPGARKPAAVAPLGTSQRVALDLEIFGRPGDLSLRLGQGGPVLAMEDALTPPAESP